LWRFVSQVGAPEHFRTHYVFLARVFDRGAQMRDDLEGTV